MEPRSNRIFTRAAALLIVSIALAACQGTQGTAPVVEPLAGSLSLVTGFVPDPEARTVDIVPTGGQPVGAKIACPGFFPDRPAVDLNYRAGSRLDLYFYARGFEGDDLVLGVVTPEGDVLCNDDGWYALNPRIAIGAPATGRYRVWIGTYDGQPARARLFISELIQPPNIQTFR